jgi:hypothetical protein
MLYCIICRLRTRSKIITINGEDRLYAIVHCIWSSNRFMVLSTPSVLWKIDGLQEKKTNDFEFTKNVLRGLFFRLNWCVYTHLRIKRHFIIVFAPMLSFDFIHFIVSCISAAVTMRRCRHKQRDKYCDEIIKIFDLQVQTFWSLEQRRVTQTE